MTNLFAALLLAAAPAPPAGLDSIRAGLHVDGAAVAPAVVLEGSVRFFGTEAGFRSVLAADGRYLQEFAGPLAHSTGFDGELAWERDWNQTPRVLRLADRDESVLYGLLLSGAWMRGADDDGRLLWGERSPTTDGMRIPLRLGDRGMTGFVDARDGTLVSLNFGTDDNFHSIELGRFEDHGDWTWPASMRQESGRGDVYEFEIETARLLHDEAEVASLLEPRLQASGDHSFDPDVSPELEVRSAASGHLLVHPRLEGRDVGWFVFDTGAGANVLDRRAAEALGYESFGDITVTGVGGRVKSPFYRGSDFQLGPLTMEDPAYVGLDLSFLDGPMGVRVAGIVGYGVLARSVVELDMSEDTISLLDPTSYDDVGPEGWTELLLAGRIACVRGLLEGHEAVFRLDSGAAWSTFDVHYPTVQRLDLLKGRKTSSTRMSGVAGGIEARAGVLESIEFGGHRFENVEAGFATEAQGAFNDAYSDGNVGGVLLQEFRLVFDYASGRMAFRDRAATNP